MSFSFDVLGDAGPFAKAIGLVDHSGTFNNQWLGDPGFYLGRVLSEETQRGALLALVEEMIGEGAGESDAEQRKWLPLFHSANPPIGFYAVVDAPDPAANSGDPVRIGLGVKVRSNDSTGSASLHLPLFQTSDPTIVLGEAGATIDFSCEVTVDSAPAASGPQLRAVALTLAIPTAAGETPELSLSLLGLRLVGGGAARDLVLSAANAAQLDDIVLELALGLLEAQAGQNPTGKVLALAKLLGLSGGTGTQIPPLPVQQLAQQGVQALADWAGQLFDAPPARSDWLDALATLVGGSFATASDRIELQIGSASVNLSVEIGSGSGGLPVITPVIAIEMGASGAAVARIEAKPFSLDLAGRSAAALPALEATITVGRMAGSGARLRATDPKVDAIRFGFGLDQSRRPAVTLALLNVEVGAHPAYAVLDLTSPEAVVEAAGNAIADVVDQVLAGLGPLKSPLKTLLGLEVPAGVAGLLPAGLPTFLADPLAAVRAYWLDLTLNHGAAVPLVLDPLLDLIGDPAASGASVAGTGTHADPWALPLGGPVRLAAWKAAPGNRIEIAACASCANDSIAAPDTRLAADIVVALMSIDLGGGPCAFLPSIAGGLRAVPQGGGRVALELPPLNASADMVGISARWTPTDGLGLDFLAPNPSVTINDTDLPLAIPDLSEGFAGLDDAQWEAVEYLLGQLARLSPDSWLSDLADGLGWIGDLPLPGGQGAERLRLADLVANPADAVLAWANDVLLLESGRIERMLAPLARALTGSTALSGQIAGTGTPRDPYRVALSRLADPPELALWVEPDGPPLGFVTAVGDRLRNWRPGAAGLSPGELAAALFDEARAAADIADFVSDRADLDTGLDDLIQRWIGSDGRIFVPSAVPAGTSVHLIDDTAFQGLSAALDLSAILSPLPQTIIRVAIAASAAECPWTSVPPGRLIDLTAAALAAGAFVQPVPATGEWFVLLGTRDACKLQTGDDGLARQAARLERVLTPFGGSGGIAIIAEGGAGHAARMVAETLTQIGALITVGTPAAPVPFTILASEPAAGTLRLLDALIPAETSAEPFDADLALGRDLVRGLRALADNPALIGELAPPGTLPAHRPGLDLHAVFGDIGAEAAARATTAILAAALSTRAAARGLGAAGVSGVGAGLRVPVSLGSGAVTVTGHAALEFFGADLSPAPAMRQSRPLVIHLEVRRPGGWLVGGPASVDGLGHDLRWIELNMTLPLGGGGGEAEIVLHEPRIFSIRRERWRIRHAGSVSTADDVVTPALPEAALLLSDVIRELTLATDPGIAAFLDLIEAIGLFAPAAAGGGGFVTPALDSLLNQPDVHFAQLLAAAPARQALQDALDAILDLPWLTIDLAQRRVEMSDSGSAGLLPWAVTAFGTANGAYGGEIRLGDVGECLRVALNPLGATLEWPHFGQAVPETIQVWPVADGARLAAELPAIVAAGALRLALERLRERAPAKPLVDALLAALGLLTGNSGDPDRAVSIPPALLSDPESWLSSQQALGTGIGALSLTKAAALADALKPLLGLTGGAGAIDLAPGATLSVSGGGTALTLGLALDGNALAPASASAPRLAFGGSFGLEIAAGGSMRPRIDVFAGPKAGTKAVHLVVDGTTRIFIGPQGGGGSEIELYPNPAGLGSLAGAAAMQVVPMVLDKIAALTSPPAAAHAAAIVAAAGDLLDLRSGGNFDGAKIAQWAADPAARTASILVAPNLQAKLSSLAAAIGPALPPPLNISASGGLVMLKTGTSSTPPVEISWNTSPFAIGLDVSATHAPIPGQIEAKISFGSAGLASFEGTIGPAAIALSGATLRPFLAFGLGTGLAGAPHIDLGTALDVAAAKSVFGRWNPATGAFSMLAKDASGESSDGGDIARALLGIALDLAGGFAVNAGPVKALLDKPVATTIVANPPKVKTLFQNVFIDEVGGVIGLLPDLFDPNLLLGRFKTLLGNIAQAKPSIPIRNGLSIGAGLQGQTAQVVLGVNGRVELSSGDVRVSLEADSRWIAGQPTAGLALGLVDISQPGAPQFKPSLIVNGIGVRVGKRDGPLVDSAIKLGSVAAHFHADIDPTHRWGGVQLQLSGLAVGAGGASGGGNSVARGIMADTGSGSQSLAPAFSPAVAFQKKNGQSSLSVSAGEGAGPWWLSVQRAFGPLYVEQVGFGITSAQDKIDRISVLLDGRVAVAGLVAAVDDLQLSFHVGPAASLFDASSWAIDLAGLAVAADISGVSLAGGLRRFGPDGNGDIEYIGMLMARASTYGLSIYGGYGTGTDPATGIKYPAFFAFGAITGPIGGPPAFFLTGIGGGIGINRDLIFPESLATFGDFVMIKALDPSSSASTDPMGELQTVRGNFPMRRGRFWFAAGISFNSFALVDAVAVVAISIGDGLELALLGLARMALPRPGMCLVSIELGLIARFSTREGVIWIQAELTENSWLLHESVRLTGGFAFVTWFKGDNKGQFVLTLGGYHPGFSRAGYPQVPRLGFRWQVSGAISIKGENYFALTSEALMAGGAFEASARFGKAWACVRFGANAIIYFDPFRFEADAYAKISAGVTYHVWLVGDVSISVSLGASIYVAGPQFHGRANFEVGPVDLTVEFGGSSQVGWETISWDAFVTKYLEAASPGEARLLTALPGKGAIAPGTNGNGDEKGTADGSLEKPFEVFSEFELTVTSIAPATSLEIGSGARNVVASRGLGIAPLGVPAISPSIKLRLFPADSVGDAASDKMAKLSLQSTSTGAFPVGVWGPAESRENKKIPRGEIIEALNGALFASKASLEGKIAAEIAYNQVEAGQRKPLPFAVEKFNRGEMLQAAAGLAALVPQVLDVDSIYQTAAAWMPNAGNSRVATASLRGGRAAPPRLGTLGERLAQDTPVATIDLATPFPATRHDHEVRAPETVAILAPLGRREVAVGGTKVVSDLPRTLAPTLRSVDSIISGGVAAKLVMVAPRAVAGAAPTSSSAPSAARRATRSVASAAPELRQETLLPGRTVPLTRQARMAPAAVDGRGADPVALGRLRGLTASIARRNRKAGDERIRPGEVAVLAMPNFRRDAGFDARPTLSFTGNARVVMLGAGGGILSDLTGGEGRQAIPKGTERIAVWAGARGAARLSGLAGWHCGQSLAYVGWSTCLCAGGSVYAESARLRRGPESFKAGWIGAREFLAGSRLVVTRFTTAPSSLIILLDEWVPGDPEVDFSLSLEGAAIARDSAGAEIAPILLAGGARRILVYALDLDRRSADVAVKIACGGSVTVAGVMASAAAAALVAARLAEQPAEAMLDPALAEPGEPVSVQFTAPPKTRTRSAEGAL